MYYTCGENKGADQLRDYNREADLRLCFRLCKLLVFSCEGSNVIEAKASKSEVSFSSSHPRMWQHRKLKLDISKAKSFILVLVAS